MKNSLLLIVLLAAACQQPQQSPAEAATIPDEKMARIMADVALADGAVSILSGYKRDSLSHVYYAQIFEMHGVSVEEYEKNLLLASTDTPHIEALVAQAKAMIASKMETPPKEETDKKK